MSRHRHRKRREREMEEKLKKDQEISGKSEQGFSLTSLLTKIDLKQMSGQLKDIADGMEKFGQITEIFKYADVFINPKSEIKGKGFNLMNLIKDQDSLGRLFQSFAPNLRDLEDKSEEKRVEPINVETHDLKKD